MWRISHFYSISCKIYYSGTWNFLFLRLCFVGWTTSPCSFWYWPVYIKYVWQILCLVKFIRAMLIKYIIIGKIFLPGTMNDHVKGLQVWDEVNGMDTRICTSTFWMHFFEVKRDSFHFPCSLSKPLHISLCPKVFSWYRSG